MRPKVSTGYLTPQADKSKQTSNVRRAGSNESLNIASDFTDSFFQKLMNCPIKRQLVLNLINSEKDNIDEYKRKHAKGNAIKGANSSSLSKIKKNHCESPTALLRRRALERQNHKSCSDSQEQRHFDVTSLSGSSQSNVSSSPSPIAFDKLLDGVVAYVEIKSKDQDRSSGAKLLMQSMGATVRDKFTKDVTHVVFKDGSFTTYQKAKLMKIHLVSVLWIEAVRSNKARVPEKKFPALGMEAYDSNVSAVCSQLQKDYEEIIREELHRSLVTGTPLPSTQSIINKRRTIMTPIPSSSQEFRSSQDIEVEKILRQRRNTFNFSRSESPLATELPPELSDDDSDLTPFINGTCIKRNRNSVLPCLGEFSADCNVNMDITCVGHSATSVDNAKARRSNLFDSGMDLTVPVTASTKENCSPNITSESIYNKITPVKEPTAERTRRSEARETFAVPNDDLYRRRTRQLYIDMDGDSNGSKSKPSASNSSSKVPSLQFSGRTDELKILSKNVSNSNNSKASVDVVPNSLSNIVEKSSSTNMSSLQISSSKEKSCSDKANTSKGALSTSMSSLLISSDSDKLGTTNVLNHGNIESCNRVLRSSSKGSTPKGSLEEKYSFSPINSAVVEEICQILDTSSTDEYVTKRRKRKSLEKGKTHNTRRRTDLPPDIDMVEPENGPELERDFSKKLSLSEQTTNSTSSSVNTNTEMCNLSKVNGDKRSKTTELNDCLNNSLSVQIAPLNEREVASHTNGKITPGKGVIKKRKGSKTRKLVNSNDSTESSDSDKKLNKTRRLYNPDECVQGIIADDELERVQKRNEAIKRKNEDTVLNANIVTISPNTFLTATAKKFVDQNKIDIKSVLNKDSTESDEEVNFTKKRRVKNNTNNQILRNSDADEQRQLAVEFINKKNGDKSQGATNQSATKKTPVTERRKSVRLSQLPRKKLSLDRNISRTEAVKKSVPPTSVFNRRSTMEFQSKSQITTSKKLKIDKNKRPSIVCTKLHKEDIQIFNQIVKKLGGFVIEEEVSSKTTHLVAGEPKRTINMLRAMTMGCWILKYEWLLRSLEERKWLPEEDYEVIEFSPAVQQCRLQRQAFGPSYTMDVFQDCGPIYIARGSIPRCSDLQELVTLCKGKICTIPRNAAIVVGEFVRHEGVKCVKEAWVLDCIQFNKRMSLKKYIITSPIFSPTV